MALYRVEYDGYVEDEYASAMEARADLVDFLNDIEISNKGITVSKFDAGLSCWKIILDSETEECL